MRDIISGVARGMRDAICAFIFYALKTKSCLFKIQHESYARTHISNQYGMDSSTDALGVRYTEGHFQNKYLFCRHSLLFPRMECMLIDK